MSEKTQSIFTIRFLNKLWPQKKKTTTKNLRVQMHRQELSAHCGQSTSSMLDVLLSQRRTYILQREWPTFQSLLSLMWFPKAVLQTFALHSQSIITSLPILVAIVVSILINKKQWQVQLNDVASLLHHIRFRPHCGIRVKDISLTEWFEPI